MKWTEPLKTGSTLLFGLLLLCNTAKSQIVSEKVFDSLANQDWISFFDAHDKCLGCCTVLDCQGFNLLFYKIMFDRSDSSLVLEGRAYIAISQDGKDTLGLGTVKIFDATPVGNHLVKRKNLALTYYRKSGNYLNPGTFPFRMGEFSLKIKIVTHRRLYFMRPGFVLREYDLNKLFHLVASTN